jgi:hypothetical protein
MSEALKRQQEKMRQRELSLSGESTSGQDFMNNVLDTVMDFGLALNPMTSPLAEDERAELRTDAQERRNTLDSYKDYWETFTYEEIMQNDANLSRFQKQMGSLPEKQGQELMRFVAGKSMVDAAALRVAEDEPMLPGAKGVPGKSAQPTTPKGPQESAVGLTGNLPTPKDETGRGMLAGMGIFSPQDIKLQRIAHNAQLYHNIAAAQRGIADEVSQMLSTLYDPTGKFKISGEEAESRFKPQVSRRALDEKIARGPQQFEDPEFETSETAIIANAITSAIGGIFQKIGLNAAGEDSQALASAQVPPEVMGLAQGANMIMSDVAKHDQKVAQMQDLNRKLAIKHQYDIEAMEREFDQNSDIADRIYKTSLENFMRFQTQRYDMYKGMENKMRELARQTQRTEDSVRLGVSKFNAMQGTTEQKFNAMMKMQYKKMVFAAETMKAKKRQAGIVMDTQRFMKNAMIAANTTNMASPTTSSNAAIALNEVPSAFWTHPAYQKASNIQADKNLSEMRRMMGVSREAGLNYYKNAVDFMVNGVSIPATDKYTRLLSSARASYADKLARAGKDNIMNPSDMFLVLSDDEDGRNLLNMLEGDGIIKRDENGKYFTTKKDAALARITAFKYADIANSMFISSSKEAGMYKGDMVDKSKGTQQVISQ